MMKKIMYTLPDSICTSMNLPLGSIEIIIPQISIEDGPMTPEESFNRAMKKDVPSYALNVKVLPEDLDLSHIRKYRAAWQDITPEASVDLDEVKLQALSLDLFRVNRNKALAASDALLLQAQETEDANQLAFIKSYRQQLRDSTESLKALVTVSGKVADGILLAKLNTVAEMPSLPTKEEIAAASANVDDTNK